MRKLWWGLVALVVIVVLGFGMWRLLQGGKPEAGRAGKSRGPVVVEVAPVRQADVPLVLRASGQVVPVQTLDVRPQVSGVIARVVVREGQTVRAGDVLFELENAAERAALAQARAQQQKNQALLAEARRTLERNQQLQAQGFIAPQALESSRSAVEALQATVQADQAAISNAQTALSWRTVRAAIGGRAGLVNVYPGSVVSLSMATPMVTLTRLDPVAVSFTVPERELPAVLAAQRAGAVTVTARLPDQSGQWQGRLSFVDNQVDSQSGTLRVKAEFSNEDQSLWPGLFVNVQLQAGALRDAQVVPVAGVQTGPEGRFVYRVQQGRAQAVPVDVVDIRDEVAIVRGLQPGTVVVVRGGLNLRSGDEVKVGQPGGARKGGTQPGAGSGRSGRQNTGGQG